MPQAQRLKYGLYDQRDHCWMGNGAEALTYDDYTLAKTAAEAVDRRLGRIVGITQVRPIPPDVNKLKDHLPTVMTTEQAIDAMDAAGTLPYKLQKEADDANSQNS